MNEEQRLRKNEYNRRRYREEKARDPAEWLAKDRLKQKARRKHPVHGEKIREWGRQKYARSRDSIRAKANAVYHANTNGARDRALAYHKRKYATRNVTYRVRAAFSAAKGRAAKRGIAFDLTMADLGTPTRCAVSGIEFDMSRSFRQGNIFVPSLDRIDPTKGYTKGNVRFVCHGYNLAKHTGTDSDVLKLARAIVQMNVERYFKKVQQRHPELLR